MSELTERLRKVAMNLTTSPISSALFEAADTIEAQSKLIEEMRARVMKLEDGYAGVHSRAQRAESRLSAITGIKP